MRDEVDRGVALAPMDPSLYLPLARACRDRGLQLRAADCYRKYLTVAAPEERAPALAELRALDPESDLSPIVDAAPPPRPESAVAPIAAVASSLAVALAIAALALRLRRRRRGLAAVVADSPELHPTIAWAVGCLRHELLKHRIGAVAEALRACAQGLAPVELAGFLRARLYGGEPLAEAWRGHLASIERALGLRAPLAASDPRFREAGRAVRAIARLEGAFLRGDRGAVEKLRRAHARLQQLDDELAVLTRGLVRCTVDGALLREAADAVRAEYAAGRVALDELMIAAPPPDLAVEMYRVDLRIVLKNVLRNAILAVGRSDGARRVAVDVLVDVEPTGEEAVRIRVRDTSPEPLPAAGLDGRRAERGLGITTAALDRYGGALLCGDGGDGFAKSVEVRLFRALDGAPEPPALEAAA